MNFSGGTLQAASPFSTYLPIDFSAAGSNGNLNTNGCSVTLNGQLYGSGGLNMVGPGTLTLTTANPFSGGTTIAAGTISLNNANAVENSTVTVGPGGGLTFSTNGGSIPTFNVGALAGVGNITLADNSYAVTLNAGGNNASTTYSGNLGGPGGLTKSGNGSLTLLGNNNYTGSTTISGGTLQVGNGGSGEFLTSANVSVASGAMLAFSHSDPLTYSGVIYGGGSLTKLSSGALTLTGNVSISGAYTVNGGTLNQAAGTTTLTNTANWLYVGYAPGTSGTYYLSGGQLSTTGSLIVGNSGNGAFTQSPGSISPRAA